MPVAVLMYVLTYSVAMNNVCLQIIEHGPAHGLQWSQSVIILTSNVGASRAAQIAKERGEVRQPRTVSTARFMILLMLPCSRPALASEACPFCI